MPNSDSAPKRVNISNGEWEVSELSWNLLAYYRQGTIWHLTIERNKKFPAGAHITFDSIPDEEAVPNFHIFYPKFLWSSVPDLSGGLDEIASHHHEGIKRWLSRNWNQIQPEAAELYEALHQAAAQHELELEAQRELALEVERIIAHQRKVAEDQQRHDASMIAAGAAEEEAERRAYAEAQAEYAEAQAEAEAQEMYSRMSDAARTQEISKQHEQNLKSQFSLLSLFVQFVLDFRILIITSGSSFSGVVPGDPDVFQQHSELDQALADLEREVLALPDLGPKMQITLHNLQPLTATAKELQTRYEKCIAFLEFDLKDVCEEAEKIWGMSDLPISRIENLVRTKDVLSERYDEYRFNELMPAADSKLKQAKMICSGLPKDGKITPEFKELKIKVATQVNADVAPLILFADNRIRAMKFILEYCSRIMGNSLILDEINLQR